VGVKEVLEAIRALTPEERTQVRAFLDALPEAPLSSQEEAPARLRVVGLLSETWQRSTTGRPRRTPVEIRGKPLSWTIVDERR
jgi:hypothetical protein